MRSIPMAASLGVVLAGAAITTGVWIGLRSSNERVIHEAVAATAEYAQVEVEGRIDSRMNALGRLATRWAEFGPFEQDRWELEAGLIYDDYAGWQAIEWIDEEFVVRWIVPTEGNEAAQDLNLVFEPRRREALETARDRRAPTVTHAVDLVQGGTGFLVYFPLYREDDFEGFVLGVFRIQELFAQVIPRRISDDFGISILDGDEMLLESGDPPTSDNEFGVVRMISMPGIAWQMRIAPAGRFERDFYRVTNVAIVSIAIITLLTAAVTYFAVAFRIGRREFLQVELLRKARTELERNQMRLRHLTSELSVSEERFRRGIAEKIHDRVSNNLILVKLRLSELARESEESTAEAIGEVNSIIAQAIDESRSMVYEISPPILFELGLAKAVEWYGDSTFAEHGLGFSLDQQSDLRTLRPDLAATLYRAFTELCVNVIKHADATRVHVEVSEDDGHACIVVSDDGKGFEFAAETGYGLFSIRERFADLGGQLRVSRSDLGGARVFVCAPVEAAEVKP